MAIQKRVLIEWHDEPGQHYLSTVSIDEQWNELEDDPGVFFYFAKQKEYEQAKQLGDNGYEFRIVEEEQ